MLPSTRLRSALVLLAILPGLLFQGVGMLRVCVHDWIDFKDHCVEAGACCAPAIPADDDCCAGCGGEPESPTHLEVGACADCCIAIHCDSESRSTLPPEPLEDSLCYAAPVERVAFRLQAPPARG